MSMTALTQLVLGHWHERALKESLQANTATAGSCADPPDAPA